MTDIDPSEYRSLHLEAEGTLPDPAPTAPSKSARPWDDVPTPALSRTPWEDTPSESVGQSASNSVQQRVQQVSNNASNTSNKSLVTGVYEKTAYIPVPYGTGYEPVPVGTGSTGRDSTAWGAVEPSPEPESGSAGQSAAVGQEASNSTLTARCSYHRTEHALAAFPLDDNGRPTQRYCRAADAERKRRQRQAARERAERVTLAQVEQYRRDAARQMPPHSKGYALQPLETVGATDAGRERLVWWANNRDEKLEPSPSLQYTIVRYLSFRWPDVAAARFEPSLIRQAWEYAGIRVVVPEPDGAVPHPEDAASSPSPSDPGSHVPTLANTNGRSLREYVVIDWRGERVALRELARAIRDLPEESHPDVSVIRAFLNSYNKENSQA